MGGGSPYSAVSSVKVEVPVLVLVTATPDLPARTFIGALSLLASPGVGVGVEVEVWEGV